MADARDDSAGARSETRWGIIGSGNIAGAFARGLASAPGATLRAVGSRTQERAALFAADHSVPRAYGSYREVAEDPTVDVVYVATPHAVHYENTMMCLEAGKPVLCEKPLAATAKQAEEMARLARARGLFLMEGMWTFTFPAMARAIELVGTGAIGRVVSVSANLGFAATASPDSRLFRPELGGGALLDVGVYGIAVSNAVAGSPPESIVAAAAIEEHGVDQTTTILLRYRGGAIASVVCSIAAQLSGTAWIGGSEGSIEIPPKFSQPDRVVLRKPGKEAVELAFPRIGNGYSFEALEVMRCLASGETESPAVPIQRSLETLSICDRVREQIGLRFPFEPQAARGA